ncbi:acyl-CoA thioester hydrolase [Cupriavidus sp. YR651]|uniref:thioesterase family protein n=1 Tax=Cupriavidus sp. YR651 TaxID=1855315 RepID=UPI00088584BF|nr:thioesterase family protein [Cupriavidus sp. YR651]SDD53147.1 acyl-CoA thioester hydrolase [Cupriavidus sp. YR651]
MYEKVLVAGWGDMDFNAHMRNTAYLDKAADVRMMYFSSCGFSMSEFMRIRLGPVVMKDEIEYFREFQLLDDVRITLSLAGLSDDGSRMTLRNDFYRQGTLAARVTSTAGWLDLNRRKLVCPPEALMQALRELARSEDFVVLPDSSR